MKKITIFICVLLLIVGFCGCGAQQQIEIKQEDDVLKESISTVVLEQEMQGSTETFDALCEAHQLLDMRAGDLKGDNKESLVTVYFYSLYGGYAKGTEGYTQESGGCCPLAIVFEKSEGNYIFKEYWRPRDGSYYQKDLKATFPKAVYEQLMELEATAESHNQLVGQLEAQIQEKLKTK